MNRQPKRGRRRLWWFGALVAVPIVMLGVLLVLLPSIARWALIYSLEQQGYASRVASMETELLAGRLSARDIELRNARLTLALQRAVLVFDWQALIDDQVRLVQVSLEGLAVERRAVPAESTPAATKPAASDAGMDWLLGLGELRLQNARFCQGVADRRLCLQLERLHWQGETRFDLRQLPASVPGLPVSVNASLQVDGLTLGTGKAPPTLALEQLQIGELRIDTPARTRLANVSGTGLAWNDSASATRFQTDAFGLKQLSLARRAPPRTSSPKRNVAERLWVAEWEETTLDHSRYCYRGQRGQSCLAVERFQLQGKATYNDRQQWEAVAALPLNMEATVNLAGITLGGNEQPPFRLGRLRIEQLQMDTPAAVRVQRLVAGDFVMPRPQQDNGNKPGALLRFKRATLTQAAVHRLGEFEFGRLHLAGLAGEVRREANGQWPIAIHWRGVMPLAAERRAPAGTESGDAATASLPPFSFRELRVEQSGTVRLADDALDTPFALSLQKPALRIGQLDSRRPEQPTPFHLETGIEEHGRLQLGGEAQPLRRSLFFSLQASLGGIDLRPATGYLEKYLGHRVKSGQIGGKFEMAVEAGKLDGLADVELRQFYLEEADQEQAGLLNRQLGTPLTASLALLRKKDKSISLNVPISGDISDPQFSSGDVFQQLTVRAINEAIKNYYIDYGLALAGVGQYSLAVKGASKLFGFLTKLRFEPIEFAPGELELTDSHKRYLARLATMLQERPEVHLTLCGYTTAGDAAASPAQTDTLTALANQRAAGVKNYLVEHQAIDPQRLIVCEGRHETESDRPPRVEINI